MNDNKIRLTAAAITLIITALFITSLCVIHLSISDNLFAADPADEEEIYFTEVELQSIRFKPTPMATDVPAASASSEISGLTDHNAGQTSQSAPIMTSQAQSPAKIAEQTETQQPTSANNESNPVDDIAARIRNRVGQSSVSKADEGSVTSAQGSAEASSDANSTSGKGLDGRRILSAPKPIVMNVTGTVKVRIAVNPQGHVTEATIYQSTGFGSRETEVRNACLTASRQIVYEPSSAATQRGIITWKIQ